MALLREILINWTGPGHNPKLTVTYWDAEKPLEPQREALRQFVFGIRGMLAGYSATIARVGDIVNDLDGVLADEWSSTVDASVSGTGVTPSVADSTQALVRWRTSTIVNGRRLRGRSFIPGISSQYLSNGNLSGSGVTTITGAAAALVATNTGLRVWHRPTGGSGGQSADVTSASVWEEFATQRRRRG